MAFTHAISISFTDGSSSIQGALTATGAARSDLSLAYANNASNFVVDYDLDLSDCQSLFIVSDQACTVKVNSSGSPDAIVTLTANVPQMWDPSRGTSTPLGASDSVVVSALYVTATGGVAGTLEIRALTDAN